MTNAKPAAAPQRRKVTRVAYAQLRDALNIPGAQLGPTQTLRMDGDGRVQMSLEADGLLVVSRGKRVIVPLTSVVGMLTEEVEE